VESAYTIELYKSTKGVRVKGYAERASAVEPLEVSFPGCLQEHKKQYRT